MTTPLQSRAFVALLLCATLAQAIFALFPGLDLQISRLFFDPEGVFTATRGPVPLLNDLLRSLAELAAAVLVVGFAAGWISGRLAGDGLRLAAFAAANVVLAPGLIVNVLLKSHVGRARPDQVIEFGGLASFTPAWQVTDQCARNCSFSSGDVAVMSSLVFCALVLAWPFLTRRNKALCSLGGAALVLAIALMRLALGRHFLSDVLFSMLFSALGTLALYPLFGVGRARLMLGGLDLAPLRAGLRAQMKSASAQAALWLRA